MKVINIMVIEILQKRSNFDILLLGAINKENIPASNSINVNNKILNIEKIKCKDFYWHLINKFSYTPNTIHKRGETYPDFNNADLKTWPRIFKLPFQVIRETKIQTFQYKILHRIISCNKWLFNIKIKNIRSM